MKARPILFSAAMILALLDGRKSQTRRIIKPQPTAPNDAISPYVDQSAGFLGWNVPNAEVAMPVPPIQCPHGAAGNLAWVRETHAIVGNVDPGWVLYRASGYENECRRHGFDGPPPESEVKWKPSIHMERRFSRITLRITEVRVERLQDISEADAKAEGIAFTLTRDPFASGSAACRWASAIHSTRAWNSARAAYEELWESINGKESWAANPWCWALTFEVIQANVDEVMRRKAA